MRMWLKAMAVGALAVSAMAPARAETLTDALISAYQNSNLLNQNQAVLRAEIRRARREAESRTMGAAPSRPAGQ